MDLASIADAVLASRAETAERLGVTVHSSLAPAPATGDPVLLERLVTNLIDNALGHNTAGGLVTVNTAAVDGAARLEVGNTGPLVAAADVGQLFQPFRQAGQQRRGPGGHGLGLAIVRAIADAHGGRVTAHSRPDGGLDIELRLPAVTNQTLASARTTTAHVEAERN